MLFIIQYKQAFDTFSNVEMTAYYMNSDYLSWITAVHI